MQGALSGTDQGSTLRAMLREQCCILLPDHSFSWQDKDVIGDFCRRSPDLQPDQHSFMWCLINTKAASLSGGSGRTGGAPSASFPFRFCYGLGQHSLCTLCLSSCGCILLGFSFAWMNFVSVGFRKLSCLELRYFGANNQEIFIRVNQMAIFM